MDSPKQELIKELHSAVVVLHELSTDSLILTKRSATLRHHSGEISFPGGHWEVGDENYSATALRELHEELGITASRVTLVKELDVENTLLGSIIHPWYATIDSVHPYFLNQVEVAALIIIPMLLVQDRHNYRNIVVERKGFRFKSCEFIPNEEQIWGATARIMQQLAHK